MVPAVANTGEDSEREGQGGGSGTIVEDSALVSSPSTSPDRDSTSYSNSQENIVISPTQQEFIMPAGVPQLVVWPLSGISGDQEVFQKKLQDFWHPPGGTRQNQHMSLYSNGGIAGVRNGTKIPLGVL